MYYCPWPCSNSTSSEAPIDSDIEIEEATFLALPRNLSYVKESYLDSYDVSGRFVHNAQTDRRVGVSVASYSSSALSDFYPQPPTGKQNEHRWSADATELEFLSREYERQQLKEAVGEEYNRNLKEKPTRSVSAGFDYEPLNLKSLGNRGIDNGSITINSNNNKALGLSAVSPPSPSVTLGFASESQVPGIRSFRSVQSSILSRVTSLISAGSHDESDCKNKTNDFVSFSSSVDGELTPYSALQNPNPDHPCPPESVNPTVPNVLRSPDRSGLIMDRGEDLVFSDGNDDSYIMARADKLVSLTSPLGSENLSSQEAQDYKCEKIASGLDNILVNENISCRISENTSSPPPIDESLVNKSGCAIMSLQKTLLSDSPETDTFIEEGVFVNMIDDVNDVTDKSVCSEVSEYTNISADSMFTSPTENDQVEEEENASGPKHAMTLEEAISKAAEDFNKMSMIMYPEDVIRPDCDFPGTSRKADLEREQTPVFRGVNTLKVVVSHQLTDSSPKESPIDEDQEFSFNRRPLRKSSSLKTNKTPPGTPFKKKVVRFADAMGLDLQSVRHVFNQESPPKIPASAMADLKDGLSEDRAGMGPTYLTPCFFQPGACNDFYASVLRKNVRLENAIVTDLTITGFVRVANIAYHKNVRIRYTLNSWSSFYDIAAQYMANSSDGRTDRFSFSISAPPYMAQGDKLEFAVSYSVDGTEYWDNNEGENYVFECFAKTIPTENENSWMHFL